MSSPTSQSRRSILRALTLCISAGLVAACASGPAGNSEYRPEPALEYHLGPGDQLRITVFNEAELTGQYVVGSQGMISYPLVGDVEASGMTIPEFTLRLQEALREYIRTPNVSVEVANYRPFFILGEVAAAGNVSVLGEPHGPERRRDGGRIHLSREPQPRFHPSRECTRRGRLPHHGLDAGAAGRHSEDRRTAILSISRASKEILPGATPAKAQKCAEE